MVKRLYLGRSSEFNLYELGTMEEKWNPQKGFLHDHRLKWFCPEALEEITGIKLKPGEIRRVKRITIELEEDK